jgi:hypothetical protein
MNKTLLKLIDKFNKKSFKSTNSFSDYKSTSSVIEFQCDKGHINKTKRY